MEQKAYLQLYLDTDYILPVAVGADGNLVKYPERLWLYFSKAAGREVYESDVANKANFEAQREGCFGDFWQHLEQGDNVGAEVFQYVELLELANLLGRLREWAGAVLRTETPLLVLNFVSTIGMKARRAFVDYILRKGFTIRSYSVEINDLLASKVVFDHASTLERHFGDQMLVLHSAGKHILLSTLTWCGNVFMQGDKPYQMEKLGDDFKKRELARMAVEAVERSNNFLSQEEREQETFYQMQFASEWLKNREGDTIWVEGFHYSRNPGRPHPPVQVDARQLDLKVADAMRDTVSTIARYCRENIVNNHLHTVFLGDAFRDAMFLEHCIDVTDSKDKYTFFNDNALQEAMGRFYYAYPDLMEPVDELERRYLAQETERERIRKYVKNAELLGTLRRAIDASEAQMRKAIDGVKAKSDRIEAGWRAAMQKSLFDQARRVLEGMATSDALTAAQVALAEALKTKEANSSTLTDLRQLEQPQVQEIVKAIEAGYATLTHLREEAKALEERPNFLRGETKYYEDNYEVYKQYKKRLNSETSEGGLRRVLKEMEGKRLTMEPLPKVDFEKVTAELACKVEEKRSGFLGMKKEKLLHIVLQVKDGAALPFPCVLQITDSQQIELCLDGWYAELEQGQDHYEKTIPFAELPKSDRKGYVAQVFPDKAHAKYTNTIYCRAARFSAK